jgi:hypothetical protein
MDGYTTPPQARSILQENATLELRTNYTQVTEPEGTIQIDPNPDALNAPWQLESDAGGVFSGNGDSVLIELPVATYTITWGAVSGFETPAASTAALDSAATLHLGTDYVAVNDPVGTIEINPDPDQLQAPWQLTSEGSAQFTGSGDSTLTGLPLDSYVIVWGDVDGYLTPEPAVAMLEEGVPLQFMVTYEVAADPVGTVLIDPNPDSILAPWQLESDANLLYSGAGDRALVDLPMGHHTLTWGDVDGWETPSPNPVTVLVEADQTVTVVGAYTETPSLGLPRVPLETEWTDHGEIFADGEPGDWDFYFWGGFVGSAVKRDGVYYIYYQGSNGYDDVESTVTYRAIGVATSTDGINFTKYSGNPVLTWYPTDGLEEGAVSAGAWVSDSGTIDMYYGANTAISTSQVSADARLATSTDGFTFVDTGLVIDHANPTVWGQGDEIFPVIGFQAGDKWLSYYVPNGTPQKALLGVAWGSEVGSLPNTEQVFASGASVSGWGAGGWARISEGRMAIFIQARSDAHLGVSHMDAYLMDPSSPASLVGPVATYNFPNVSKPTVLLDRETDTWFLYYQNKDATAWGVRTAPVVME